MKIFLNNLFLIFFINFLLLKVNCFLSHENLKYLNYSYEICGVTNGEKIYLELNDYGEIKGTNITTLNKIHKTSQQNDSNIEFHCSIELITCPACIIQLKINFKLSNSSCDTDYLLIGEPPYDNEIYSKRICGKEFLDYQSNTRSLSLKFIYKTNHNNKTIFKISYEAQKNFKHMFGYPSNNTNELNSLTITSPYFPVFYPRDYAIEYFINCLIENCVIQILFTDYQISTVSTFEIFDNNSDKRKSNIYSGTIFRPPIILSRNRNISVKFYANGGTGMGYKALIKFLHNKNLNDLNLNPITDCGGTVENLGGAITMMNMINKSIETKNTIKYYDCIWIIKPPSNFFHLKTHLSIWIESFSKMIHPSKLVIRQGITSDRGELEVLKDNAINNPTISKTYIVPLSSGFYVRLSGSFGIHSKLAIVYTTFSYLDCYIGSEYLCQNHKCIPIQLHCDGFDHCGDGSDEPAECPTEWEKDLYDRKWYSHIPNYYFPKTDRYPDLKAATTIFLMSSLGLIILISSLIIILYRMGVRARHQRELQNHLQTISEFLDNNRINESFHDEPPVYEPPPDYNEVIKVGMESKINMSKRKKRRSSKKIKENINSDVHSSSDLPHENEIREDLNIPSTSRDIIDFLNSNTRAENKSSNETKKIVSGECYETKAHVYIDKITKRQKLCDFWEPTPSTSYICSTLQQNKIENEDINLIWEEFEKNLNNRSKLNEQFQSSYNNLSYSSSSILSTYDKNLSSNLKIFCKNCLEYYTIEIKSSNSSLLANEGCPICGDVCTPFLLDLNNIPKENLDIHLIYTNQRKSKMEKSPSYDYLLKIKNINEIENQFNLNQRRKSENEIHNPLENY